MPWALRRKVSELFLFPSIWHVKYFQRLGVSYLASHVFVGHAELFLATRCSTFSAFPIVTCRQSFQLDAGEVSYWPPLVLLTPPWSGRTFSGKALSLTSQAWNYNRPAASPSLCIYCCCPAPHYQYSLQHVCVFVKSLTWVGSRVAGGRSAWVSRGLA